MAHLIDVRGQAEELVIPSGGSRFDNMTVADAMREQPYTEEIEVTVPNLRRVFKSGNLVGVGTDVGIVGIPYGARIFAEFGYYRDAGLSPREILTAATINNAKIIELEDELGSITEGKKADLVLLDADPMVDIMNASVIRGVMRNGQYFSADELNADTPQEVVTRLRNAYNAGDLEAIRKIS
ncbi:MAG: amidohydrolase family protein [Pseudomonadota bacterium]